MEGSVHPENPRVGPGAYFALLFAMVFFSGLLGGKEWYGVFDFTTLNGAFGKVVTEVSPQGIRWKLQKGLFAVRADSAQWMVSCSLLA